LPPVQGFDLGCEGRTLSLFTGADGHTQLHVAPRSRAAELQPDGRIAGALGAILLQVLLPKAMPRLAILDLPLIVTLSSPSAAATHCRNITAGPSACYRMC